MVTKAVKKISEETGRYYEAVGRRKTAVARVRLFESARAGYTINDREVEMYFATEVLRNVATSAMTTHKIQKKFKVVAKVHGGGTSAQAEAVRHGIARALLVYDIELRGKLKKEGFLKRDAREKERRKFGLKKARKAAQWSKR